MERKALNSPFKIAQIGYGSWGKNIWKTISKYEDIKPVGLYVRSPKEENLPYVSYWEEFLDPKSIDGVVIALPPKIQAEIIPEFLKKGIPVFAEKPICDSKEEFNFIQKIIEKYPTPVMVDYIQLFSPAFRALKEICRAKGPIKLIKTEGGNAGPYRDFSPLWDYGPHELSFVLSLLESLPSIIKCSSFGEKIKSGKSAFNIFCKLNAGVTDIELVFGNNFPKKKRSLEVYFENEVYVIDDLSTDKLCKYEFENGKINKLTKKKIEIENAFPLDFAVREFIKGPKGNSPWWDLSFSKKVTYLLADMENYISKSNPIFLSP